MVPVTEYFRSVEHIWILWLGSLVLLACLTRKLLIGFRGKEWKALLAREDGAAYSISYVMTFPFFLILVCLVIETTMFLIVKMGTVHAAYAAARSNIVWRTTAARQGDVNNLYQMKEEGLRRAKEAAVNVMAAFGSSNRLHLEGAGISGPPSTAAGRYYLAYYKYTEGNGSATESYITAKYRFATVATSVKIVPEYAGHSEDVTATVTYEMPINLPILGRFLGTRAPWPGARFYTFRISSSVALQNEAPKNNSQTIGIYYVSR